MFCHKCGNQLPEDSGFCTKCGTKLIADDAVLQTTATPQHETITPVSTITEDTQQSPSNNATKVNGGVRNIVTVGRVLMGISLLLLFLGSFFSLSINPIIIVSGVAIGTILSALGLKRPLGMTKIIELVVACILLVAAIAYAVSSSSGGVGGGDKYVQMVKDGTLDGYPQKTVGEAFGDFLDNPKWESGLTENGERFVNVKGGILYLDKETELAVQFFVDEKSDTFLYNASEMNGVPQNDLIFWSLLETIYNDDSTLAASSSQSNLDTVSSDNRIVIGETQSYDNEFGNMEVTLDYIEFINKIENPLLGGYNFPDEGSIFLRAAFTLKNIGTEKGSLITAWSTAVYDGTYEFNNLYTEGTLTDINPLTPPATGSIIFMVPNDVAESDNPLVINIDDDSGKVVISYVIRPSANTSGENGTARVTTNNIAETTDQVLFCGTPIQDVIGMTKEQIYATFGEHADSTEDYISYGSDTSEWMQFDFLYGNEVSGFSASPEKFTFNGQSLVQNYDTMLTLLGDNCVEQGGTTYAYSTAWAYGDCQISFRFPTYRNETEDDRVMDVSVYPIG